MRKFIIAGLMAATIMPAAAQAQISPREHRELRGDRRDIRDERHDVQRARAYGDRGDVRQERRELRGARQEFREDRRDAVRDGNWGRNDWRGYRNSNPRYFARGNFRSDYRYRSFSPGIRIGIGYYSPRYYVNDYARYRLPRPGYNQRWVRHYDDILLIDTRRGYVIDVIRGFYR